MTWQRLLDGDLRVELAGPLGPLGNNSYLITVPGRRRALVVDAPSGIQEVLLPTLRERQLTLELIVTTHQHFDHVAEAGPLAAATGAGIAAHRLEGELAARTTSPSGDPEGGPLPLSRELDDGDVVELQGVSLRVLHTPGHTPGSICLYLPQPPLLFSGDTLFAGSFGRYDLPGGDPHRLREALRRLAALPPPTRVLPGHGRTTTIGAETWLRQI
ncbi:MAG TPA: MBL fold metallo-hydrolase [Chloroflexota bacterium]|jgi:hydroxyacylglutathione hydrolase|nr:MBL fold metallo-hydrolase [Chloroflexota bacterium]